MPDIDELIIAAVSRLQSYALPADVQWAIACELVALKYGWTIDEASENLSNLLATLEG